MEHKSHDKRLFIGLIILLIGAALLASNFGLFSYEIKRYFFRWEMILIGVGFFSILANENKAFGVIVLAVGGVFYARDFLHFHYNFWELFFPAMLIVIGLVVIFHHKTHRNIRTFKKSLSSDDMLDEISILGGSEKIINSNNFQGGKMTSIFGGQKIILSRSKLAPGKNELELFAVFGGFELIIPEDWKVNVNITPIFGGFSDKRLPNPNKDQGFDRELTIIGTVIFGGGEIKSF
jgi:predicted membrane protein